ncbi:NAD(P)/FAD-dependent oxidoreductase [Pseudothermotoga sp. U03pept]|uniref:NAD(P)/FAD-dependent oxidoreductase n=1 Tax=Pseudothermotoga sp. U03pept TaxID=3447012 RepID=UPI003F082CB4
MHVGIVGAGPAGVSAAVFLKRCGARVTIFEKNSVGGLITNAWRIENVPFMTACGGEKVAERLKQALHEHSIDFHHEKVATVCDHRIVTNQREYFFDKIIVASGTLPKRLLNLEVSNNVVCEYRYLPRTIESLAILGAGDAAFDGALKAFENGIKSVHIFNRTDKIKAVKRLRDLVERSNVVYHPVEPIVGAIQSDKLVLRTSKSEYAFDALLICIGRIPNLSFVREGDSIHIVGDARGCHRQMSIAVGQAIETAMKILEG